MKRQSSHLSHSRQKQRNVSGRATAWIEFSLNLCVVCVNCMWEEWRTAFASSCSLLFLLLTLHWNSQLSSNLWGEVMLSFLIIFFSKGPNGPPGPQGIQGPPGPSVSGAVKRVWPKPLFAAAAVWLICLLQRVFLGSGDFQGNKENQENLWVLVPVPTGAGKIPYGYVSGKWWTMCPCVLVILEGPSW